MMSPFIRRLFWPVLIVAAVRAVFGPALHHDFAGFDDSMALYWNPHMGQPLAQNIGWYWAPAHSYMHLYTPVVFTVWNVLAAVGGKAGPPYLPHAINPEIFHAASLVLHAICALLVFTLLRRLIKSDMAAGFGALLFALHPLQVETIAWASGLKDVLCTAFSLASIWFYLSPTSARMSWWRMSASLVCLVLAILSKPAAVMVPALAGVIDLFIVQRPRRTVALKMIPMLLVAGALAILGREVQPNHVVPLIGVGWRPLIVADSLAFYLGKLAMPWDLCVAYGRSPAAVKASGVLAWTWTIPVALAAIVWSLRKNRPWLTASALLFALAPLPVLGWIRFDYQRISTVADHYMNLAMIGPALFLASCVCLIRSRVLIGTIICLLVALAVNSSIQLSYWRTNLAVWQNAVIVAPDCPEAHENLAFAYLDLGPKFASEQVREFRTAVRMKPRDVRDRDMLAGALISAGRMDEAMAEMLTTVRLQEANDHPGAKLPNERLAAYLSLGDLLLARNHPEEAGEMYRKILHQLPHDRTARRHLALSVYRLPNEKPLIYLGAAE